MRPIILISLISIGLLTGCGHIVKQGYAPYCMVNYQTKVADCRYGSMQDCRNAYGTTSGARVCFPNRNIK